MKRFFKRFFVFLLLVTIAGGGIGYYYGLRPDNYQQFFGDLKQKYFPGSVSDANSDEEADSANESDGKKSSDTKAKTSTVAAPKNPYARIDKHARACPKSAENNVGSLAAYLQKGGKTDLEKARSIYVWLTKNVSYDDDGYNTENYGDLSPEGVLKSRKAVCSGFAALYDALGKEMGLEIKNISGYAKGYGYVPGTKFTESDHAWNMIRIDGQWRVFDATWGEGYGKTVNGKLKSTKSFDKFWFNADPHAAIFTHYPEDPSLTFVSPSISLQVYEKFPYIRKGYFQLGFDARTVYKIVRTKGHMDFPEAWDVGSKVKVVDAPMLRDIKIGKPYLFRFHAPAVEKMALLDAKGEWFQMRKEKEYFFFEYTPNVIGPLKVNAKLSSKSASYQGLLIYQVVGGKVNS
jgi:hypothetical protein